MAAPSSTARDLAHVSVVTDPPTGPQPADIHAAGVTWTSAVGFLALMGIAGWAIGKVLGDEYRLLPELPVSGSPDPAETAEVAKDAVASLRAGAPHDGVPRILKSIDGPRSVTVVLGEGRLDALLDLLHQEAARAESPERRAQDQGHEILTRAAARGDTITRTIIVGAMIEALPRHKRLGGSLLAIARSVPDAWNDMQQALEAVARTEPAIARMLREHCGQNQPFVAKANDTFMSDMVRFKRLAEDHRNGMGAVVRGELQEMIDHELLLLESSRHTSRRFSWIPTEARNLSEFFTGDRLKVVLAGAERGHPDPCGVLSQLVLSWSRSGDNLAMARDSLDALRVGAARAMAPCEALLAIFAGIQPRGDSEELTPHQKTIKRYAYERMIEASDTSLDIVRLLRTHGLEPGLYEDDSDDPTSPEPMISLPNDGLRKPAGYDDVVAFEEATAVSQERPAP